MTALSLRGRPESAAAVARVAGRDRFVVDYLVEEVLDRQPAPVRDFLIRTAILDRLTGPLGDALTDGDGGAAMLDRLERENLFVIPLDAERRWYRYHHLFAGALRDRLERTSPSLLAELHRRAADWLEQHGSAAEAIDHALAGGDVDLAAGAIEANARALLRRGEVATLARRLDRLPAACVDARPRLALARAWVAVLAGHVEPALAAAEVVEHGIATIPDAEQPAVLSELASMRAYLAEARS